MPDFPELVLVLVVLFIVFGARKFPALGERLGRWIARQRDARRRRG